MPWPRNPFSHTPKPGPEAEASASDVEPLPASSSPPSPSSHPARPTLESFPTVPDAAPPRPSQDIGAILAHFKTPTPRLSGHQIFYIFVLDGLGAGILSGGINFAVAYAMYTTQDTLSHPIRLFRLPNTLAGDAAVTIILQSLITWFIEFFLVRRDLAAGGVSPIGFLPRPTSRFWRRLFLLDEFALPSATEDETGRARVLRWGRWTLEQAGRAMLTAVAGFVLFWPVSVAVLMKLGKKEGGDWTFEKSWTPQVFKLVLGGGWGMVQTPVYAGFWLVREGWVILGREEDESDGEEGRVVGEEDVDVVGGVPGEARVGRGEPEAEGVVKAAERTVGSGRGSRGGEAAVVSPVTSNRGGADEVAVVSDEETV
ncbi:hypothetical protein GE09DRAFT_743805 [Coniochaeta sp. 2T2.1]|nr:hypothetical protein GE09DRAFT_743805 [Coniochaeta sp. 2T2.1]